MTTQLQRRMGALVLIVLAAVQVGCGSKRVDMMSGRLLVELDESWAAAAAAGDMNAIMDSWTEDAVMYAPGLEPLYGKLAIRELIESRRSIPSDQIAWTPSCAGIEEGGTMAYTLGTGTVILPDHSGVPREHAGRYVAIWKKGKDRWHCAVKCWTPSTSVGD